MNRKIWMIAGAVLIILLSTTFAFILYLRTDDTKKSLNNVLVRKLIYCTEEQEKPCVVSFSLDANDNMLVNLLLPDLTYPRFYLKIIQPDGESRYECQRATGTIYNAYCTGKKAPPGVILHLLLISTKDEITLAEGELSIIGLAYPTLGIAEFTEVPVMTESPAPTEPPARILPTSTRFLPTLPADSLTSTGPPIFILPAYTRTPPALTLIP